jgi:hypothetical protein
MILFLDARHPKHAPAEFRKAAEAPIDARLRVRG